MFKDNPEQFFEKKDECLIEFARSLVRIRSYSDQEGELACHIAKKMRELSFDEVFMDTAGNVVGRIGTGPRKILFDSHMDTVEVNDEPDWDVPPFAGEIKDGRLYGRGSVDMKSGLAASVFAAVAARELGYLSGKSVYVTATACEEYRDGENLKLLFREHPINPDCVVICEPSDNVITLGHKGKAQMRIRTHGISAHGSAPEKGINAVYEMAEIISRVERLNQRLSEKGTHHGTVVLSEISCVTASLNAVPSECSIYLDRRLVPGETEEDIRREMEALVEGKKATWEIGTLRRKSWKGADLVYTPFPPAWKIDPEDPLVQACNRSFKSVFGKTPEKYDFWDFGTNAVTPVSMGIPTIGFGPGEYKLAHMVNENCEISKIKEAFRFYATLVREF
jgi:putative selenium metabolism hydrolase